MRHRKNKFKLNRFTSWRKATIISLSKNLFIHQSIKTTKIKAKAARPLVEKLITLGKRDDLASRREAFSILQDHKLVKLLFSDISPRFSNRNGGYCRILPLGFRRGDGARLVLFELTEKKEEEKKTTTAKKEKTQPEEEISKPAADVKPAAPPTPKPPLTKKPTRKFLGGLRKIFKKERDSL